MARRFLILLLFLAPPLLQAANPLEKLGLSLFQDALLPADEAFRLQAEVHDPDTVVLRWQIADGYYLYRDRLRAESQTPAVALGPLRLPPGLPKTDPEFGSVEIYHGQVAGILPLRQRPPDGTALTLKVHYQGCAEKGICYPPIVKTVRLTLPPLPQTAPATTTPDTAAPLAEQDRIARAIGNQSFWLTLASFLGFGILLAFTPCCFPMLPILSGIIVGHGHRITTARAFLLSLTYVLASALTYTAFGVLAGLFGANLQAAFQHPWVIAAFAALFVALALSMFGLYELQMPASWQTRLSRLQGHGGSLVNAAVMGVLSALIVGPCVAAPLAGALIYIGQTGDALLGGAALFAMGLGMGLPLLAVGTSAGRLLPKAGLWMNTVKAVFGVVMLGVAIWMLERILPPALTLLLWALWLIVPAIYLGAATPLPETASHSRRLGKALGVVMLTYGILLLVGLAAGSRDVFQPLKGLTVQAGMPAAAPLQPQTVASPAELDRALTQARGHWTMLDFYADWCISCKELEHQTFTDPGVRRALAPLKLLKADVTADSEAQRRLLRRFDLVGPPALIFFDPQGRECRAARLVGYVDAEAFLRHLQSLPRRCPA
ncbi:thioredoxin:protein disulfide reductase [Methylomarinovum tepidoasis]|uniref:Thiol:disulfide interchange protein DsbD n=1 Tax=Methylomarinovum tepidoasis TaxID=2840183 RepID=A0AAU9C4E1_9GAMM|nr:protein-disulfide reductase DsbD [Methylomarinovum sp. IN45]BCX87994.1 thioredoxin:protein disulfide reductase [Methylomarinovum sp. IN45]